MTTADSLGVAQLETVGDGVDGRVAVVHADDVDVGDDEPLAVEEGGADAAALVEAAELSTAEDVELGLLTYLVGKADALELVEDDAIAESESLDVDDPLAPDETEGILEAESKDDAVAVALFDAGPSLGETVADSDAGAFDGDLRALSVTLTVPSTETELREEWLTRELTLRALVDVGNRLIAEEPVAESLKLKETGAESDGARDALRALDGDAKLLAEEETLEDSAPEALEVAVVEELAVDERDTGLVRV